MSGGTSVKPSSGENMQVIVSPGSNVTSRTWVPSISGTPEPLINPFIHGYTTITNGGKFLLTMHRPVTESVLRSLS